VAWAGWYEYGGVEIINASRTEAYARNAGLPWFRPSYKNEALPYLLGDESYSTPMQDDAPWTDYRDPDTYDFLGAYPLSVEGIEDSTWMATVTENALDGGVIGRVRRNTRNVVFQVALIGRTDCGAEAGMRWLRQALTGQVCMGPVTGCNGQTMCYIRCEPTLDMTEYHPPIVYRLEPTPYGSGPYGEGPYGYGGRIIEDHRSQVKEDFSSCLVDYLRSLRNVTLTVGPQVQSKQHLSDGGSVWVVGFTAVAGNPYEWSQEVPIIRGFMDPEVDIPYAGGEVPDGAMFDDVGFVQTETTCPEQVYTPVYDPACPFVVPPPGLPSVDVACWDFPINYTRRQFIIPEQAVTEYGEAMPVIQVRAPQYEVRNMRLRFYTDAFGTGDPNSDPCNFCGDMVFSYIPFNSTIVLDSADQVVYLQQPGGQRRRADSLVFGSDGQPFEWPSLTCGVSYIATVDLPQTQQPPIIDLSLYHRAP